MDGRAGARSSAQLRDQRLRQGRGGRAHGFARCGVPGHTQLDGHDVLPRPHVQLPDPGGPGAAVVRNPCPSFSSLAGRMSKAGSSGRAIFFTSAFDSSAHVLVVAAAPVAWTADAVIERSVTYAPGSTPPTDSATNVPLMRFRICAP